MIIKSLELANFRNYEELNISFDKGTNILYGDNAQGKTNILEAIYVSATTKSHKGSKDKEIINFNKEEAHIRTYLEKENVETEGMLLNEKYFPCRFSVAYGAAGKRHHALCDSSSERKRKYYFI